MQCFRPATLVRFTYGGLALPFLPREPWALFFNDDEVGVTTLCPRTVYLSYLCQMLTTSHLGYHPKQDSKDEYRRVFGATLGVVGGVLAYTSIYVDTFTTVEAAVNDPPDERDLEDRFSAISIEDDKTIVCGTWLRKMLHDSASKPAIRDRASAAVCHDGATSKTML